MPALADPFAGRSSLDEAMLAFLGGVDSPTVANAVETFSVRDRCDGFIGGQIQCQFPDLGPMVGRALTVTMSNAPGPVAGRDGYWRLWETLAACSGPVVLAVADASGAPHRVAFAGEIMTTLAQRLGAVGMVTDGAFRDVDEVHALGFHYFMKYPVVSHANFWIESVGEPVVLDGERIETGDILHGDRNGIVVIPDAVLPGLEEAVGKIRASEAADMAFIRSPEFTLDGLKTRKGYGSPA
ncbi:MAG: RraA family protein [Thermomicrobiales bacterium]